MEKEPRVPGTPENSPGEPMYFPDTGADNLSPVQTDAWISVPESRSLPKTPKTAAPEQPAESPKPSQVKRFKTPSRKAVARPQRKSPSLEELSQESEAEAEPTIPEPAQKEASIAPPAPANVAVAPVHVSSADQPDW